MGWPIWPSRVQLRATSLPFSSQKEATPPLAEHERGRRRHRAPAQAGLPVAAVLAFSRPGCVAPACWSPVAAVLSFSLQPRSTPSASTGGPVGHLPVPWAAMAAIALTFFFQ